MQFGVATEISVYTKLCICVSGLPSLHRAQVLCLSLTNTINFLYTLMYTQQQTEDQQLINQAPTTQQVYCAFMTKTKCQGNVIVCHQEVTKLQHTA